MNIPPPPVRTPKHRPPASLRLRRGRAEATLGPPSASVFAGSKRRGAAGVETPRAGQDRRRYVKALGGKKRVTAVRDATYEWTYKRGDNGRERDGAHADQVPASARTDVFTPGGDRRGGQRALGLGARHGRASVTLTEQRAAPPSIHAMIDANPPRRIQKAGACWRAPPDWKIFTASPHRVEFRAARARACAIGSTRRPSSSCG